MANRGIAAGIFKDGEIWFQVPVFFFSFQYFASGHYEKALLAICAGDVEDY